MSTQYTAAPGTDRPYTSPERTIGQLVADARTDLTDIARHEVALAKAELKDDVTKAGVGAGLLAGAAFLGVVAFVLLCITAALGLEALGLPGWAAFLIVAGVLLLLAAILALVGKKRLSGIKKPERTISTAKGSLAALKGQR